MSENKQDTITVELPIGVTQSGSVRVAGYWLTRDNWRSVVEGLSSVSSLVAAIAPAVVAWIERDEWKPLDLPAVGRTIKATLRDGRVETFKVGKVVDGSTWAYVSKADSYDAARFIQRRFDVDDLHPTDIIAWEYVDETAEHTITTVNTARAEALERASIWVERIYPAGLVKRDSIIADLNEWAGRATRGIAPSGREYARLTPAPAVTVEQLSVMAQTIEDRCWCQSCGSGGEHVRELLAKAGLTVAGEANR